MNSEQVYAFFDRIGLHPEKREGSWVMACCPLAEWTHASGTDHSPSFGVHIEDDGMSFYNCFSCHHKGPVSDLAKRLGKLRDEPELTRYGRDLEKGHVVLAAEGAYSEWGTRKKAQNTQARTKPKVFISREQAFEEYPSVFVEPKAVAYLRRRGIGFSTCEALQLRYDPKQFRVLFPVWYGGRLVGFSGRSVRGDRYIRQRNADRKGSYPKIRDYKGLEKEVHLLTRPPVRTTVTHNIRCGGLLRGRDSRRTISGKPSSIGSNNRRAFVIVVEGLFGFASLQTIAPDKDTVALMGSVLTEGKRQRLLERGQAIYWLTDNDEAGWDCLYGKKDPDTGRRKIKTGALYKIGYDLPQFTMSWPALPSPITLPDGTVKSYKDDPDQLTRDELEHMIATATIYVHKP